MRIAVDAMGGDHAPREVVRGAIDAVAEGDFEVILVGPKELVRKELDECGAGRQIEILDAPEVIDAGESPAMAVRRKKNSTIVVGLRALREGAADAFVSAGNTGALMAGGLLVLGRLEGVRRPALGVVFPTLKGSGTVVLDVGASTNCRPEDLYQFGIMGAIYARQALGIENPRVSLLNIGSEESKGDDVVKGAHALFKAGELNFTGNVEARDILSGVTDVVVCDGFAGNVALKATEGSAGAIMGMLKEELTRSPWRKLLAAGLKPAFRSISRRMDYSEYGGTPLFGLSGIVIKCHGSSKAKAFKNGIIAAARYAAEQPNEKIRERLMAREDES